MEGTLWRTVAVQPAVLVGWQPGASAPGFFPGYAKKRPASAGLFLERRSQAKRKPAFAGFLREAQAQDNIGFCFIVLYNDLLNGGYRKGQNNETLNRTSKARLDWLCN